MSNTAITPAPAPSTCPPVSAFTPRAANTLETGDRVLLHNAAVFTVDSVQTCKGWTTLRLPAGNVMLDLKRRSSHLVLSLRRAS